MRQFYIALFLLVTVCLKGQDIKFGVEAGFNSVKSKLPKEYNSYFKQKPSFIIGITVDISFTKLFNIHSGLYFSQLGTKAHYLQDNRPYSYSESYRNGTINSIIIPANYFYEFKINNIGLFGGIGFEGEFNISGKSVGYDIQESSIPWFDNYHKDFEKKAKIGKDLPLIAFGFNVYGGVKFKDAFFVKLFLTQGLSNIDITPSYSSVPEKQQQFGLTIGYMFQK